MEDKSYQARMRVTNPKIIQLYSANTPNGMKVAAVLEELVELRKTTDEFIYEPHTVDLRAGESHLEPFRHMSLNAKVPVLVDPCGESNLTYIINLL